jgi:methionyl-tRNA formyltransferase
MLAIPKRGVVNLHPSYLPFNKGWHTASYALLYPQYPYGATLHMMTEDLDSGPIIHQKKIDILPEDTADSLYKRCMALEFEVFKEAWPALRDFTYKLQFQPGGGTRHNKKDLVKYQEIDHWPANIKDCNELLIRQLRALTTNDVHEAAYFIENGKKYYCQIHITPEAEIK